MFAPVASSDRGKVALAIAILTFGAALIAYLFQAGQIELGAAAVGLLGGLLAFAQWVLSQAREAAKIRWEAVRAYYAERDIEPMTKISKEIFEDNFDRAAAYCNFFEKWGRLVQMGYMPDDIFDGSTGVHIVNAFRKLFEFIKDRQIRNPLYASSYLWLVAKAVEKPAVAAHVDGSCVRDLLQQLNVA